MVTAVVHLFALVIYDIDHPVKGNAILYLFEAVIWQILIKGILQPIAALVTAIVCCPLTALLVILAGVIRRGFRAVWDTFMFHAVIRKRGRVPASNTFVARRTAGPGLASNYFYQIKPEQALAAVEAELELHELKAWETNTARLINQPKKEFTSFINQLFKPFSAKLDSSGCYKQLEKEAADLQVNLNKEVASRKERLRTGLSSSQSRIKLTSRELKVTVSQTTKMLESFYPEHVIKRLPGREETFWEQHNLEPNDWQGLATQILSEVFSTSFLTPLEETDICFKLQVEHLNLVRYMEMLKSAEFRDDLDIVSTVHTPKGDIDVDPPSLELDVFKPGIKSVNIGGNNALLERWRGHRWKPWKRRIERLTALEKLEVPLPIPHPVNIAVLIHNREHDQEPLELDDYGCSRVLKAAKAVAYAVGYEVALTDIVYETDGDVSTPDHTTNSEPEVVHSHLAEQERAFSDDNVTASTPESIPDSITGPTVTVDISAEDETLRASGSVDSDTGCVEDDLESEAEAAVVYTESEADTSCVVDLEEGEEECVDGVVPSGQTVVKVDTLEPASPVPDARTEGDDDDDEEDIEDYEDQDGSNGEVVIV